MGGKKAGATAQQVNTAIGEDTGLAQRGYDWQGDQYRQMQQSQAQVNPFYSKLATQGLPFYRQLTDYNRGAVAQAFAPARGDIYRRTSLATNLPSGYRDALINNLNAQQARAFDATQTQAMMANEQAKQQGAAGLMGQEQVAGNQALSYGAQSGNANQAVITAPRRPTTWGMVGGAMNSILPG